MRFALSGNYRTLLIELMLYSKEDTVFLIQDVEGSNVSKCMIKNGYRSACYYRKKSCNLSNLFSYYKQEICIKKYIQTIINQCHDSYEIVGSDHIYSLLHFFFPLQEITVVEEGFANYTPQEELYTEFGYGTLRFIIYRLLLNQWNLLQYHPYGYDSKVCKIILTGIRKIPLALQDKVELIDLEECWKNCNQQLINNIFSFTHVDYSGHYILLTQPLSEDGICSEHEKLLIYQKIIAQNGSNVIIKPHPREKTNYIKLYPGIIIAPHKFPFELALLNNSNVLQVITITSTAAYGCIGLCKVVILGTEDFPELQRALGVHPRLSFN